MAVGRNCALRGFEMAVVRDEDAMRTEIHFVLIEYLQLVEFGTGVGARISTIVRSNTGPKLH